MKNLYTSVLLLLVAIVSKAQYSPAYNALIQRELRSQQAMLREETPAIDAINGLDYDLVYARLELRINPDTGKYVKGAITTYFKTGKTNFNRITFDMASALLCDSVQYHGVRLSAANVVKQVDTLRITIPSIPNSGTLDSIKVFYKGVPPEVPIWTTTGFVAGSSAGHNYIHTLSEPYSAHTWWPSKSRIAHDKFDSVDIIVSTPSAFRVAANGKRISEPVTGAHRLTTWRHRYPISTYQIAIGVAKYIQYPTTPAIVNIGGTNMELYNLLWPNSAQTAAVGNTTALNRTAEMLSVMSSSFSDYPFKNEKYGHYAFGFGGGMEHNTFSGMHPSTYDVASDWNVIAHELGHQWFGGSVTCGSWRDIWVNEGFARYSEVVYLEGSTDNSLPVTPQEHRAAFKKTALKRTDDATVSTSTIIDEPIYQSDTTSMNTIFNPAVYIYERGAMFISMLRKTVGDAKFFQALRNYQLDPDLRYKNAYTEDVKRHFEAVSGLDLSEMFQDWVHQSGYPSYSGARWNNVGNQVVFYLPQTRVAGVNNTVSPHFDMPIVLRIRKTTTPARDTTIILFDKGGVLHRVSDNGVFSASSGGSIIQVGLSFVPTEVQYDPWSETLSKPDVSAALVPTVLVRNSALALLATKVVDFAAVKEGKNAKLSWAINQSVDYASFEIERSTTPTGFTNVGSRTAGQAPGATSFTHTDFNIPAGIIYYRIKVIEKDGSSFYTKVATVNNKSNESFVISPNPATDHIMISHGSSAPVTLNLKITDAAGKVVKTISKQAVSAGGKLRIPMDNYAAGTYYVEIEGEEYFKVVRKIALIK